MKKLQKIVVLASLAAILIAGTYSVASAKNEDSLGAKYQQLREQYLGQVEKMKEAKVQLRTSFTEMKQKGAAKTIDTVKEKGVNFLANTIKAMINRLEALRNRVENIKALTEADRTQIFGEIDQKITWLNQKKTEVEGLTATCQVGQTATSTTATSTPKCVIGTQSLKDKAKEVKGYWENVQVTVKKVSGLITAGAVGNAASKADALIVKLEAEIAKLKGEGKNTAAIEADLAALKTTLTSAKDKVVAAKAKFMAIIDKITLKANYDDGMKLAKEGKELMKDAHKDLVQITNDVRKLGRPATATTTDED